MNSDPVDRINSYAVVAYIPEPFSSFLDGLRKELVSDCAARVHLTILPPRPLSGPVDLALEHVCATAAALEPFEVQLEDVEVFPMSDVIYLAVGEGRVRLHQMHAAFNSGGLKFREEYNYHPHITLAQSLQSDQVDELSRVARDRWAQFKRGRRWRVDKLTFVQNTRRNRWVDLADCALGAKRVPSLA